MQCRAHIAWRSHNHASPHPTTCTSSESTTRSTSVMQTMIHPPPSSVSHSMTTTYHSPQSAMTNAPMTQPTHTRAHHPHPAHCFEASLDAPARATHSTNMHALKQHTFSYSNQGSSNLATYWPYMSAIPFSCTSCVHAYTCTGTASSDLRI